MIRIISLTEEGRDLGTKIKDVMVNQLSTDSALVSLHYKPKPFSNVVQAMFTSGDRIILICAMGIAIRTLAPVLKSKLTDPAVLVLDEDGRFVVPILSGHEGGANHWANELAGAISAETVITTAKPYIKPVYTLGMGCERHCPVSYLAELRDQCLDAVGLSLSDIHSVSSIDLKFDEVGLIQMAKEMDRPFNTWSVRALSEVEHLLSTKSDYVYKTVGVYGVAESAALVGAKQETGEEAELILVKQKNAKATCAIARSYPSQQVPEINVIKSSQIL